MQSLLCQYWNDLLNRNEGLHGLSLDYGTEINSCKSISLQSFVGEVLWESDNKNKVWLSII